MRCACTFALLGLAMLPPLWSATPTKQKKSHTRAASKSPVVSKTKGHASARRSTRTKHVALTPSYQIHPDPERYAEIQKALASRGFFKGEANGVWGDDSADALRRFQAAQNMPDSEGKINALSLNALGLGAKHDNGSLPPGSTVSKAPVAEPPPPPSTDTPPTEPPI